MTLMHFFTGYAALFGTRDRGGDIIVAGALDETLARRDQPVRLLWQHDPNTPLGILTAIKIDDHGLHVAGRLATESRSVADIAQLLRAGVVDGLSIGYRAVRARRDAKTGIRLITKIDLWEVSVVTFPMQPNARLHLLPPNAQSELMPIPQPVSL